MRKCSPTLLAGRLSSRVASALAGVSMFSCLLVSGATEAQARERLALETPRLQPAPLTLRLQPESARLVLSLPPELMPARDLGLFGRPLDPNKYWNFGSRAQPAQAHIGQGLGLSVDAPRRALQFHFSLLPRAAVAELRFDPMGPRIH